MIRTTNAMHLEIEGQNLFVVTVVHGYLDLAQRLLAAFPGSFLQDGKLLPAIVQWLLSAAENRQKFIRLLEKFPDVTQYIPDTFWLTEVAGKCALWLLVWNESGRAFLAQWLDSSLESFDRIPSEAWGHMAAEGSNKGMCALYLLAQNKLSHAFLARWLDRNPKSFDRIPSEAWGHMATEGSDKGTCALYLLARTESGRAFLTQWLNSSLESFNHIPLEAWGLAAAGGWSEKGMCALYWLARTESGCIFLARWLDSSLESFDRIPSEAWGHMAAIEPAWGHMAAIEPEEGKCALYHLSGTTFGRAFLVQWLSSNRESFYRLPSEAWGYRVTRGPHKGKCALYHLSGTESGRAFLTQWLSSNPESFDRIPSEAWGHMATEGSDKGMCVLYWLAQYPAGQVILLHIFRQNTEIISKTLEFFLCSYTLGRQASTFLATLYNLSQTNAEFNEILMSIYKQKITEAIQSYQTQCASSTASSTAFWHNNHKQGKIAVENFKQIMAKDGVTAVELKNGICALSAQGGLRKQCFSPLIPLFAQQTSPTVALFV